MNTSQELRNMLRQIDRKGYPAYKQLRGTYRFPEYVLDIEHVQGDPFAAPSKVSIHVDGGTAAFPEELYRLPCQKTALEDTLLREMGKQLRTVSFQAKGSGKSGLMSVSSPGQEVLERSGCQLEADTGNLILRMEIGFPANGRTINARELEQILFDFLPKCAGKSLYYKALDAGKLQKTAQLAEDQHAVRNELKQRGLVAFVANGAILPRESGVSSRPMKGAVPFQSPPSMEVELTLPNKGKIVGMGIKKGVTLIVGGGYHGKSTLLKALELGVYNHIAGDGREFVITDDTAMKLRAEDGRSVRDVDISMFIRNLPNGKETDIFCTEDASGSTSQAANVVEAMETGSDVFLIDEDTSATNFMIRDELMQLVVTKDKEPITPYIDRVRELYDSYGVSTILVAGSSGEYFNKADKIIQMDEYHTYDITEYAKDIAQQYGSHAKAGGERAAVMPDFNRSAHVNRDWIGDRVKIKINGKDMVSIYRDEIDTRYLEQLVDEEQLRMIGYLFVYMNHSVFGKNMTLQNAVEKLFQLLEKNGLKEIFQNQRIPCNLAMPRQQELYMCMNRFRKLI